jgi:splicing factor 3A subunit 3
VDISNLPGGIQDAWVVLSDTTQPARSNKGTINNPTISFQEKDSQKPATLPMGQGQLGKIASMTALSACVRKASEVSNRITLERQERDGALLKSALDTTKRKLSSVSGNSTTQAVAATTKLWMRVLDHRLKEIRSYHARNANNELAAKSGTSFGSNRNKNPNKRARLGNPGADGYDLASSVVESLEGIRDGTSFSSEEVMGKYLDLQPLYESYVIPIKSIMKAQSSFGFTDFLALLSKGESGLIEGISESTKLKERKKYVRFLVALENYLEGFLKRMQPLLSKEKVTEAAIKDFEDNWSKTGGSPGWEAKPSEAFLVNRDSSTAKSANSDKAETKIDLSPYASAADLEKALDGDALKAELTRLGLKCGGTVADRAKRLFMTKDTPLSELPKKLFAKKKAVATKTSLDEAAVAGTVRVNIKNERRIDIAKREVVVMAYLNQLKPLLEATMRRTGRRETQTTKEREKEMDEDLHGSLIEDAKRKSGEGKEGKYSSDEDSDDDDAPIYNPKGVPLGWDGKPIPYWLFKLHGLNHFHPCEICGGESYRGRKNFETHFAEARHSYGMKSLGIPNTKHFHGVTKIEDAQILWKKLKDQLQQDQFDGTNGEEYEDSHGNVLSRATYEDLARQGLL